VSAKRVQVLTGMHVHIGSIPILVLDYGSIP
jgi:hypothetical protein